MTQESAQAPQRARYWFGDYCLCPEQRQLRRGEHAVKITPRALDLLTALVQAAGQVLGREELLAAVWAGLNVTDSNLTVSICTLRRVLGDAEPYIATVPGRGYQFTALVRMEVETPGAVPAAQPNPEGTLRVTVELLRPDESVAWTGRRQWPAASGAPVEGHIASSLTSWLEAALSTARE